ncbi:MAG: uroporphyrinogen decarboxylase [Actinomycetota bacterium]|nr:uroporphyrinogen decarboxylase [Actinomycetota bacterium]
MLANPNYPVPKKTESAFLAACRGEPHDRTPVWFMRQAGRSLPEYRAVRGDGTILDAVADPERATIITLQPVHRYGVDAAILFSDIMVPVHAVDFGVDIHPGVGPVVDRPFNRVSDLERLRPFEPDLDAPYVAETVRQVVGSSPVPVIGFAGGPFTIASYLVEGMPSRALERTRALMAEDPGLFEGLMSRLADIAVSSLRSQVKAGASAVQLFDTWAGTLDPDTYQRQVFPHSHRILNEIAETGVPRIHFVRDTRSILRLLAATGPDVVGVGWQTPLDEARRLLGPDIVLQGNLDPAICLEPLEVVDAAVADVLARNNHHPGHVFNLGHGVLPDTDPEVLAHVVELVHAHRLTTDQAS